MNRRDGSRKVIEDKRKRLEQLRARRKQRESRAQADDARVAEVLAERVQKNNDILAKVEQDLTRSAVQRPSAAGKQSTSSSTGAGLLPPRPAPKLAATPAHYEEIPPLANETYDIETQVDETILDASPEAQQERERELDHYKIKIKELESENEVLKEVEEKRRLEEERALREEEERLTRELSEAEQEELLSKPTFTEALEKVSLFVERALTTREQDWMRDYTQEIRASQQGDENEVLSHRMSFLSPLASGRPITSLDFSQLHHELLLSSSAGRQDVMSDDPDGLVNIWSMNLLGRPEFTFTCQSAVLVAKFHPSNPKLVIGGTFSGQIVVWDTRQRKATPVTRTAFSAGHTFPVYSLNIVPSVAKTHNIVSISNDARLCVWADDVVHEPSLDLELKYGKDEITTSCSDFLGRDPTRLILGSHEGQLYKASTHEDAGISNAFRAHSGLITGVDFHPVHQNSPAEVADVFLTSSYDWTCKLWSYKNEKELLSFEHATDYVFDVQWSPVHPSLFAYVDAAGMLSLWNLNKNSEEPIVCQKVNDIKGVTQSFGTENKSDNRRDNGNDATPALNCLHWSPDGKQIAVGDSEGRIIVLDVSSDVAEPCDEDQTQFYRDIKKKISA